MRSDPSRRSRRSVGESGVITARIRHQVAHRNLTRAATPRTNSLKTQKSRQKARGKPREKPQRKPREKPQRKPREKPQGKPGRQRKTANGQVRDRSGTDDLTGVRTGDPTGSHTANLTRRSIAGQPGSRSFHVSYHHWCRQGSSRRPLDSPLHQRRIPSGQYRAPLQESL